MEEQKSRRTHKAAEKKDTSKPRRPRRQKSSDCDDAGTRRQQDDKASTRKPAGSLSRRSKKESFQDLTQKSKPKFYPDHWAPVEVKAGLQKGQCLSGQLHINKNKLSQGFVRLDALPMDIFIDGTVRQNRGIDGDQVVVLLDPVSEWKETETKNADGSNEKICKVDDDNIDGFVSNLEGSENGCTSEEGSTCKSPELDFSLIASLSLESESDFETYMDDAVRGIDQICKVAEARGLQPTGKVVAIDQTRPNPKRDRVIGLLVSNSMASSSTPKRKLLEQAILSPLGSPPRNEGETGPLRDHMSLESYYWFIPSNPRIPKLFVSRNEVKSLLCSDDSTPQESLLREGQENTESRGRIVTGDKLISAAIGEWDCYSRFPKAILSETIGDAGTIAAETRAIIFENSLKDTDFSERAYSSLPQTPWSPRTDSMSTIESLFSKLPRKDLTNLRIFTIDPPTARDLDDALHVKKISGSRYEVGVHIADVSHFLRPETALDEEAESRATSVYLVQRVIPMLPRLLCEELCSLNAGVSRFAVSIIWQIEVVTSKHGDKRIDICSEWVGKSIIHSRAKLSYPFVQEIIDGTPQGSWSCKDTPHLFGEESWSSIIDDILILNELAQIRRAERLKAGSIKLDNVKIVFERDEDGMPMGAHPYVTTEANQLIEEFMLLANMSIARIISDSFPSHALLRRHEPPDEKLLEKVSKGLREYNIYINSDSSMELHQSIDYLKASVDDQALAEMVIQKLTKPMKMALYFCTGEYKDPQKWRHYALNTDLYTHFTSPIRRFPDVIVHRLLCGILEHNGGFLCLPSQGNRNPVEGGHEFGVYKNSLRLYPIPDEHSEILLRKVGIPLEIEQVEKKALHYNERKAAAKNAQESSIGLYLALYFANHPVAVDSLCTDLGDKFLSLFVPSFGIEVKLFYDAVLADSLSPLVSRTHLSQKEEKNCHGLGLSFDALQVDSVHKTVSLDWKDRERDKDILRDEKVNPKPDEELNGVKKQCFPIKIAKLSHVPILLLGRCGNGFPPSIECTLYV